MNPLLDLSYSSRSTLHLCPRKFQIEKNIPHAEPAPYSDDMDQIDFTFGKVIHHGIQQLFNGAPLNKVLWQCINLWKLPIWCKKPKSSKSYWTALDAVCKSQAVILNLRDEGWEIAKILVASTVPGLQKVYKSGVEISFRVNFPNNYRVRGHIDLILRHKGSGEYKVVEIKTTGFNRVDIAQFANSEQSLGYSVIMDIVAPEQSSYEVLYLIWKEAKGSREWEAMPYIKSKTEKAEWIHNALIDIETVELYKKEEFFPKNGNSCFSYFRQCEFFQQCSLPLKMLVPPAVLNGEEKFIDKTKYDFEFTLMDLIANQLDATEM